MPPFPFLSRHGRLSLSQEKIHHPASSGMRLWPPAMRQDVVLATAGMLESIGKNRQAIESTLFVNRFGQSAHGASQAGTVQDDRPGG
jgi:hypothetical protein